MEKVLLLIICSYTICGEGLLWPWVGGASARIGSVEPMPQLIRIKWGYTQRWVFGSSIGMGIN